MVRYSKDSKVFIKNCLFPVMFTVRTELFKRSRMFRLEECTIKNELTETEIRVGSCESIPLLIVRCVRECFLLHSFQTNLDSYNTNSRMKKVLRGVNDTSGNVFINSELALLPSVVISSSQFSVKRNITHYYAEHDFININ